MDVWTRASRIRPVAAAAAALLAGLVMAPLVAHHYDVFDCFLTWSRASAGRRPWAIYLTHFKTDCDYPPVVPYLLTVVEAVRRGLGAAETGAAALLLVKLPGLLAWMAHVPLLSRGLRRPFGARVARVAAVLAAFSLPLFVNAAAWGQFDAFVSLSVCAAVVALLHGRPAWAGAALGLGLATKLLVVVAVPVLLIWALRRLGLRAVIVGALVAVLVLVAAAVPFAAHGAGRPVLASYHGAVGYYTFRTGEAYNVWYLLDRFEVAVRGLPPTEVKSDTRRLAGPVTHRHVGLALFAAYMAFLLLSLWRHPTARALVLVAALQFFAFFMLPTQVHQRYVLPAAVLAGLVAPLSRRTAWLFVVLAVTATLNQGLDLGRAVLDQAVTVDPAALADAPAVRQAIRLAATVVALANVTLLAWATVVLPRELALPDPDEAVAG